MFAVIFSLLFVQFTWTANVSHDIENNQGYGQSLSSDEDENNLLPENRPWTVPYGQIEVVLSKRCYFGIHVIMGTRWPF